MTGVLIALLVLIAWVLFAGAVVLVWMHFWIAMNDRQQRQERGGYVPEETYQTFMERRELPR